MRSTEEFSPLVTSQVVESGPWRAGLFRGKVVFVTGGSGTICRVQTELMVGLGADAVIVGRRESKIQQAVDVIGRARQGSRVLGIANVDVSQYSELARAVEQAVHELGHIDFVIAGAAGNFLADIHKLSSRGFQRVVDIDLIGSYNTLKALLPQLTLNKDRIVFVSATLHYSGLPFQAHASAAKAGVDALMRVAAVELGPHGVTSNAIAPGPIAQTEGLRRLAQQDKLDELARAIPVQRFGTSLDIAHATVFLFSNAASFITGSVVVVDGGHWHVQPIQGYPEKLSKL